MIVKSRYLLGGVGEGDGDGEGQALRHGHHHDGHRHDEGLEHSLHRTQGEGGEGALEGSGGGRGVV